MTLPTCQRAPRPEHIQIIDNAIIPLAERVADRFYDPLRRMLRVFGGS